jgi:hypothetical protein
MNLTDPGIGGCRVRHAWVGRRTGRNMNPAGERRQTFAGWGEILLDGGLRKRVCWTPFSGVSRVARRGGMAAGGSAEWTSP